MAPRMGMEAMKHTVQGLAEKAEALYSCFFIEQVLAGGTREVWKPGIVWCGL